MTGLGRRLTAAVIAAAPACGGAPAPSSSPALTSSPASTPIAPPSPTTPPSGACSSTSLGVCTIADAGARDIPISRAGANGIAIDPTTGRIYVVINGATSMWCGERGQFQSGLAVVDAAASREVALVASGEAPVWPLVDTVRGKVLVAASGGAGTIAVHDRTTGALERSFTIGGRPHDLGLDPLGRLLLVSNTFDRSQTWISTLDVETGAIVSNVRVPELPHKVVVDETRRVGYAVSLGAGAITAVDLTTGAKIRDLTSGPVPQTSAMSFSPSRRRLYVGKTGGATPAGGPTIQVVDVDSGALVGEVGTFTPASSTATRPWGGFGLDDGNGLLYAAVANSNLVAVVDIVALRPLGVFEVAACPWAVALDVPRGAGYVTSNASAAVSSFSLRKVMTALGR